jgi:hypothetical protein
MDELLDQRLALFPLIKKIEDPIRRDRAYGAVRDATTAEDLERYGKYLSEITTGQLDLLGEPPEEPPDERESFRRQVDRDASQILNSDVRIRATRKIAEASTIEELQKFQARIEDIVIEQSRARTGQELVDQVGSTFGDKEVSQAIKEARS